MDGKAHELLPLHKIIYKKKNESLWRDHSLEQRQNGTARRMYHTVLLHQLEKLAQAQKLKFARATRLVRTTAPGDQ